MRRVHRIIDTLIFHAEHTVIQLIACMRDGQSMSDILCMAYGAPDGLYDARLESHVGVHSRILEIQCHRFRSSSGEW